MVAGRRDNQNDDGMRDGEWLAHELMEQQQQRRMRGYPIARLRREREPVLVGGAPFDGDLPPLEFEDNPPPIAWEPDPFDVNLDLEEDDDI